MSDETNDLDQNEPFNPLDKANLGISVADAMLARPVKKLPLETPFKGAGIYAIYYAGGYTLYKPISRQNRDGMFGQPIYVGKAVPQGARKGGYELTRPPGNVLFKRLSEHAASIQQCGSLNIADFSCRYLIVDDIWIPLGESLLIQMFSPLWNLVIDGFGNHDPGRGRMRGERSLWDTLHPGRSWVKKCKPNAVSVSQIEESAKVFLQAKATNISPTP